MLTRKWKSGYNIMKQTRMSSYVICPKHLTRYNFHYESDTPKTFKRPQNSQSNQCPASLEVIQPQIN